MESQSSVLSATSLATLVWALSITALFATAITSRERILLLALVDRGTSSASLLTVHCVTTFVLGVKASRTTAPPARELTDRKPQSVGVMQGSSMMGVAHLTVESVQCSVRHALIEETSAEVVLAETQERASLLVHARRGTLR